MQSKSMRIFAPTGALGMGFLDESLARAVDFAPEVIGCDAGSTDSGPTHLGAASPKMSRAAIERDLRRLLRARHQLGVPLVIGSCGTAGTDSNVDWMREITNQLVREEGLKVRVGAVYAEQDGHALARRYDNGKITALPGAPLVDRGTFESCSHIVAMMGAEPLQQALDAGADVVLAGRASDTALFAALPLTAGLPAGPVWHCAKTIECGAVCATRQRADGMLAEIDERGFTIEPAALDDTATPISIAAHTLYENADPFLIREPSGTLNTTDATYAPASNRATRVEGSKFEHESYTVKLEGAAPVGYQTVVIGGVRDPVIIAQLDSWLADMRAFFVTRAKELFGVSLDRDVKLEITVYGRDAVMGATEPQGVAGHEVGLMFTVTAPTQVEANEVARFVAHAASHWPVPEWDGFISGIAFPFSPPEMDRGQAYRFALHHVVHPRDPFELFRFDYENLAS